MGKTYKYTLKGDVSAKGSGNLDTPSLFSVSGETHVAVLYKSDKVTQMKLNLFDASLINPNDHTNDLHFSDIYMGGWITFTINNGDGKIKSIDSRPSNDDEDEEITQIKINLIDYFQVHQFKSGNSDDSDDLVYESTNGVYVAKVSKVSNKIRRSFSEKDFVEFADDVLASEEVIGKYQMDGVVEHVLAADGTLNSIVSTITTRFVDPNAAQNGDNVKDGKDYLFSEGRMEMTFFDAIDSAESNH